MAYTLSEAVEATGRSRATILRALQTGKLEATHHEATDDWAIEPDDLFRIFPVAYHIRFVLQAIEPLRSEMHELRARLEAAETAIGDLRGRLDAEPEERPQPPAPPPVRRGWWPWQRH
jgi:hypothetical protein